MHAVSLSMSEEGKPSDQCKETSSSWLHHQGRLDIGVEGRGVEDGEVEDGEDCEVKEREVERWAIESMVAEPNLQEESKEGKVK